MLEAPQMPDTKKTQRPGPLTPNPNLGKAAGGPKSGKTVKGTTTPTKRG